MKRLAIWNLKIIKYTVKCNYSLNDNFLSLVENIAIVDIIFY